METEKDTSSEREREREKKREKNVFKYPRMPAIFQVVSETVFARK